MIALKLEWFLSISCPSGSQLLVVILFAQAANWGPYEAEILAACEAFSWLQLLHVDDIVLEMDSRRF
ncbi:hypothetical protein Goari_016724, partial [Gossypium aridum]|nr:hypothetical protein [Gossypium aridum]